MEFDFLSDPRYSVRELSDAIMNIPNQYSLLTDMGLFPERGIRTTYVEVEVKDGYLNLIPTSERGAPAPKQKHSKRTKRVMKTEFQQIDDNIRPSDMQNLPEFGSNEFFEQFDNVVMERMDDLQKRYRQTHEYMRWGALRGDVYDADGTTVLYNCYDEMGETQRSIDFKFGTTSSDTIMAATKEARRYLEDNLFGEPMAQVLYLCSAEFFDNLTNHPKIEEFYKRQQDRPNPLVDDLGFDGFKHGTAIFIEHNGKATYLDEDGASVTHRFIPENEAIGVPLGTQQVFRSYYAPGEMMSTVNLPGQSMYMSMKELDHGRGVEIHTESAPLFLVQKPRLVMRCHSSN